MRKMKDSGIEWIGEIPEEWDIEKLKYHVEFNPTIDTSEFSDEDEVSFVPMENLKDGYHTTSTTRFSEVKKGYVQFSDGDILIAKVTPCFENGNLAIANNLISGIGFGSTEINVIRCKTLEKKYLFYYLQNRKFIERAIHDMYGVAGLKRLVPSFIPESYYPIPIKAEQQQIAEYLDKKCTEIDSVIKAKEATNEKLKEYRGSIIYEVATKGLDKTAPMKDSGIEWIGDIPKRWELEKLKYITILDVEKISGENDLMYIGLEHIRSQTGKIINDYEPIYDFYGDTILFHKNNVLYGKLRPYLAKVYLTVSEGKCSSEFFVLQPKDINSKYLFYLTLSKGFVDIVDSSTFGVKMPRAEWEFVGNLKVPVPTENAQQHIGDYLDKKCAEIDSVISANEKTIEKLIEYRQSAIYEAVTGKVKV